MTEVQHDLARIQDHLARAQKQLEAEGAEDISQEACVWWLLKEAAETNKSIRKDGPRRQTQHGLEYHHTSLEIWGTELAMAADGITYEAYTQPLPTKQALGRYLDVMGLLTFIRGKSPPRMRKMVLAVAGGMTLQRAADIWGYGSRAGVLAAKKRSIDNILHGISALKNVDKELAHAS